MGDIELTGLHLDVYDTRQGLWNPEHGDMEIPDDWDFLPTGDAFMTRRVKTVGTYWVAWRPRGRNRAHRRRLGLWAPRPIIEAARVEAADTAEERAKRRVHSTLARERREASYQQELEDAIRRFLAFDPKHADLEGEIGREAAARAAEVGSGRVGRTQTLLSRSGRRWRPGPSSVTATPATRMPFSNPPSKTRGMKGSCTGK